MDDYGPVVGRHDSTGQTNEEQGKLDKHIAEQWIAPGCFRVNLQPLIPFGSERQERWYITLI